MPLGGVFLINETVLLRISIRGVITMAKPKQVLRDFLLVLLLLSAAFFLGLLLQNFFHSQSLVSMVFVLAVFLISLITQGYFWGVFASLAGVLIDNYVFSFPYFAFDFLTSANFVSALVMLIVAILTCTLTTKLKRQDQLRMESEKEKMRGNLLRAISHDLRTPLTTIYGSCSALIDNYDSLNRDQQLRLLRDMQEDSENLIRIVENLLSVTRVNGEAVAVRKTPTVLEELIDSVLQKFHKRHPNQNVEVTIPENFVSIPMDALLIEQVLINLLENAVDHARGMTKLCLSVYADDTTSTFEVSDNGCGIPKDRLEHLFSGQYYNKDTPFDSNRSGMGIGLSVCSAIIRAHSGTITGGNKQDGGAAFRFSLEMERSDHEQ